MSKDLEVRHCRILVAVSQHGGVAAAARVLGIAQSTVSETLLSLERVVGQPLTVRRTGREAILTATAHALLPHAQALIAASEIAIESASLHSQDVIRLGTVESICSFLLPAPLLAFRSRWPRVDLRVKVGLCQEVRKGVQSGELDAAITVEGTAQSPPSSRDWGRVLCPVQLWLLVRPSNPLAAGLVDRSALKGRTFLLADPDGAFKGLLERWIGDPVEAPRVESAGSVDGVKRGVVSSDAIGVLPSYAVAEEVGQASLATLRLGEPLPAIAVFLTACEQRLRSSPLNDLVEQIGYAVANLNAVDRKYTPPTWSALK